MKEFIKTLDDLRPEDIRFPFDPLNKKLCFGGGGGGGGPVTKIVQKAERFAKKGTDVVGDAVSSGADALQTNLETAVRQLKDMGATIEEMAELEDLISFETYFFIGHSSISVRANLIS